MSKNIRIIFFILLLVFVFFTVLIVRFNSSGEETFISNDEQSLKATGFLGNDYYSYKNENNLFGVRDAEGKKLTEALWKDIKSIEEQRFIVQDPDSGKYGIVDINESIVVPPIYKKFVSYDNGYIIGISEKNDGKNGNVLFDTKGNVLIEEEWDSCNEIVFDKDKKISGRYLQLKKNRDYCRIKPEDGSDLRMYYIEMNRELLGRNIKITAYPSRNVLSLKNAYSVYRDIVDMSTDYLTAVFNGNASEIKKMVDSEKYGDSGQNHNEYRGSELKYLGDIHPVVSLSSDQNGETDYYCKIKALILVPGDINNDGSYLFSEKACEFTVSMEMNSEGMIRITKLSQKNIDKQELNLPEDFYPEETTATSSLQTITETVTGTMSPQPAVTEVTGPKTENETMTKPLTVKSEKYSR